ncbi:CPBP family intramembrane metalloprotease [Sulfurospirillum sp. T05]|uniref:CPBP family intramembrane metalloprotease n=1 Tax=Sulfurospirillum tamanense TaxID=2813362 RepID=A0ABS2WTK0_9BACT|nr:CPBP family intramembrane glutamic endopeptidase [Sulfurospirillum tamanensis]MBN2964703.1 CPBP family intramembrane metalloprotease [Sulfurospirillum tamanensis]
MFWFLGAFLSHQETNHPFYMPLMLSGLIAPFVIGLLFLYRLDIRAKLDFYERIYSLRRIRPVMLFAFLIPPLSMLLAITLSLLFGGEVSQFAKAEDFSFEFLVPALTLLILAATFEELGWRGYAFDSLAAKFNLFGASLVFGVLWSAWHFPLVFVKDSYQYQLLQEDIWLGVNFFISIVPLGVILSWVCVKNNKSILIAILYHLFINLSQEMFQVEQSTKCIQTVVLFFIAGGIVWWDKKLFFRL